MRPTSDFVIVRFISLATAARVRSLGVCSDVGVNASSTSRFTGLGDNVSDNASDTAYVSVDVSDTYFVIVRHFNSFATSARVSVLGLGSDLSVKVSDKSRRKAFGQCVRWLCYRGSLFIVISCQSHPHAKAKKMRRPHLGAKQEMGSARSEGMNGARPNGLGQIQNAPGARKGTPGAGPTAQSLRCCRVTGGRGVANRATEKQITRS